MNITRRPAQKASQSKAPQSRTMSASLRRLVMRHTLLAAGALLAIATPTAHAANYYWDPSMSNTDPGSGGTGNWDTASTYWKLLGTSGDVVWPNTNANTATFAGTAGTVTINSPLNALGLIFNTSGYTLAGGTTNNFFLYGSGIDTTALSNGTTTINQGLTLSANQTWKLGAGNVLNLGTGVVGGTGQLTISGGTTNYTGAMFVAAKFVLNSGAVFNSSGTANLPATNTYTGIGDGTSGTMNVTAGSFTTISTLFLGNTTVANATDTGTVTVSGGTLTTTSTVNIGDGYNNNGNGIGVLTVSNNGTFTTGAATGNIRLGNVGSGSGTINLDGGTFSTNATIAPGSFATTTAGFTKGSVFNFNGGTLQATGGSLSIASTVTANVRDNGAFIDTNGFNDTIAANLVQSTVSGDAGTGGLIKNGVGVLTLSGTNTYTGHTTVNGGILDFQNAASLPGGASGGSKMTVANGAGLGLGVAAGQFSSTDVDTIRNAATFAGNGIVALDTGASAVTYAGNLTNNTANTQNSFGKTGTGTLTLAGASTYTGATIVYAGTLQVGDTTTNGSIGTGAITNVGTLSFNRSDTVSYANTIMGTGTVQQDGRGTLNLSGGTSGAHNIAGSFYVNNGGTVNLSGYFDTYSPITNLNKFDVTNGTLNLTATGMVTSEYLGVGDNTTGAAGALNINGGTLTAKQSGAGTAFFIAANSTSIGTVTIGGGTLDLGTNTNNSAIYIGSGYNGSGGGAGTLIVNSGAFTTGTTTGNITLGTNSGGAAGTGEIDLNGGTLSTARSIVKGGGTGTVSATLNFNGGTLQATGNNATFLQGLTAANVKSGGAIINTQTYNVTINQALLDGGGGGLTKSGAGTLTLTNTNTYTGATNVSAGTLTVNGSLLNTSAVTVGSNATLNGIGNVGTVALTGGSSIGSAGTLTTTGITVTGEGNHLINGIVKDDTNVSGGGSFAVDTAATLASDIVNVANGGTLTVNGSVTGNANPASNLLNSGTVTLGSANALGGAAVTLSGGTLNTNTTTTSQQGLGTLTLGTGTSTLDFGAGNTGVTFQFANYTYAGAPGTLNVSDWTGSFAGGGTDQFVFQTNTYSNSQLANIFFVNPNGTGNNYTATQLASGEIVPNQIAPTPEPGSVVPIIVGMAGLGILIAHRRRKANAKNFQNELAEAV